MTTDKQKATNKRWVATHREAVRAIRRRCYRKAVGRPVIERHQHGKTYTEEFRILTRAKYRAKKYGIPFNITIDDITFPKRCPVLGIEIRPATGRPGGANNSPSLDRIQPHLGYTKGNVRVISNRANVLKNNATVDELLLILKDIEAIRQKVTP